MAWYKTGTLSITSGATSVTGVGTSFASNVRVGDGLRAPDGQWYEIVNIASETTLGIYPAYAGATVSASANWVITPIQGYVKESADRLRAISNEYSSTLSLLGVPAPTTTAQLRNNIGAQTLNARLTSIADAVVAVNSILIANTATTMTQLATGAYGRTWLALADQAAARTSLGLGTAAYATVTTSTTDTTAGRLIKVGDFGLGSVALTTAVDTSSPTTTGFNRATGATTGKPVGVTQGVLFNGQQTSDVGQQLFLTPTGTFVRSQTAAATYGTWRELADRETLSNSGVNLLNDDYSWVGTTLPAVAIANGAPQPTPVAVSAASSGNGYRITTTTTTQTQNVLFAPSNNAAGYNVDLVPGTYLVSCYIQGSVAGSIRTSLYDGSHRYSPDVPYTTARTRVTMVVNVTDSTRAGVSLQYNYTSNAIGTVITIDSVMIERQIGGSVNPSSFTAGPSSVGLSRVPAQTLAQMQSFGLGTVTVPVVTDLNTLGGGPTTYFRAAASATNLPVASIAIAGQYIGYAATAGVMIVGTLTTNATNTNKLYYRNYNGSVWGAWRDASGGDYGLGLESLPAVADLDAQRVTAWIQINTTQAASSGLPNNIGYTVNHIAGATPTAGHVQWAYPVTSVAANRNRVYKRQLWGTGWSSWQEVMTQGSVVGTVSQASGVPTGAIIERGDGVNGGYTKYADGTLECYITKSDASVAIGSVYYGDFRSTQVNWNYPAAFISAPTMVGMPGGLSASSIATTVTGTATGGYFYIATASQAAAARSVHLIAKGRWY